MLTAGGRCAGRLSSAASGSSSSSGAGTSAAPAALAASHWSTRRTRHRMHSGVGPCSPECVSGTACTHHCHTHAPMHAPPKRHLNALHRAEACLRASHPSAHTLAHTQAQPQHHGTRRRTARTPGTGATWACAW